MAAARPARCASTGGLPPRFARARPSRAAPRASSKSRSTTREFLLRAHKTSTWRAHKPHRMLIVDGAGRLFGCMMKMRAHTPRHPIQPQVRVRRRCPGAPGAREVPRLAPRPRKETLDMILCLGPYCTRLLHNYFHTSFLVFGWRNHAITHAHRTMPSPDRGQRMTRTSTSRRPASTRTPAPPLNRYGTGGSCLVT